MNRSLPRLHAITNDAVLGLPDFHTRAVEIAASPVATVHVRSGNVGGRRLTQIAESVLRDADQGCVFVNDRADVARIVGAAGLHLPSTGLSAPDARSIVGRNCWIGRSTHSTEELVRVENEGVDYAFLGPIWPTASHPTTEPLGPRALSTNSSIPVIAIGGITPDRVSHCLDCGAYGVAVISALWRVSDIASTLRALSLSFPT